MIETIVTILTWLVGAKEIDPRNKNIDHIEQYGGKEDPIDNTCISRFESDDIYTTQLKEGHTHICSEENHKDHLRRHRKEK